MQSGRLLHGAVPPDGHHLRGEAVPAVRGRVPPAQDMEAAQHAQGHGGDEEGGQDHVSAVDSGEFINHLLNLMKTVISEQNYLNSHYVYLY